MAVFPTRSTGARSAPFSSSIFMTSVAQTITEQDIEDLAHYIPSLD
jgi:cytochrome c553